MVQEEAVSTEVKVLESGTLHLECMVPLPLSAPSFFHIPIVTAATHEWCFVWQNSLREYICYLALGNFVLTRACYGTVPATTLRPGVRRQTRNQCYMALLG